MQLNKNCLIVRLHVVQASMQRFEMKCSICASQRKSIAQEESRYDAARVYTTRQPTM